MVQSGEGADEIIASYLYYFVHATGVKMVVSGEDAFKIIASYLYCFVQATGVKMVQIR